MRDNGRRSTSRAKPLDDFSFRRGPPRIRKCMGGNRKRGNAMKRMLLWPVIAAALVTAPPARSATSGSLVIAFATEPTTIDPASYTGGADSYAIPQVFEQLVRLDASGKPVNWLAESWTIEGTADQPVIDVHLRPGIKFQNGDPLTSADFEFSFRRLRDHPKTFLSAAQKSVDHIEIVDDLE